MVWRKKNLTAQRVFLQHIVINLLSGFLIGKHGPLMLACMSKLHVINLIQSVRHLKLGPCRGSNSVAQPLAQSAKKNIYNKALGHLEIIDRLIEIGEFLLNMYVIILSSQLHLWHKKNFAGF